ncbi:MAG: ABC transporter ATP-binding protein [Eubacteriales bacterium]|nr:ABC transporter ATP-binding protein [Eubacteriales bacterium]
MSYIKESVSQYKKQIFTGQFFKFIEAVLELMIPVAMAVLIDEGVAKGNQSVVLRNIGYMVLLSIVGVLCALVCQVIATKASVGMAQKMRNEVFEQINKLSSEDLDEIGTNSLVTRLTLDINNLQDSLAMLIRLVVRSPFLAIGSIVMAVLLDINMSVVFFVTIPLIVLIMFLVLRIVAPRFTYLQKHLDRLSRRVDETLLGTRVIRAFSQEQNRIDEFQKDARLYEQSAIATGKISALLSPLTSLVMNLGIVAVLVFSGNRIQANEVQVGTVIAFIEYLVQIFLQTAVVANLVIVYTRAYASARRVEELMTLSPSVKDVRWQNEEIQKDKPINLEFKNVGISFSSGKPALKNISFTLNPKETLGIIGGTGSGKSTVARLILRLFDLSEGEIKLSGKDLKDIPLKTLRSYISYVPQHARLFRGTIKENMLLSNPSASDEDIIKALKDAQADFVFTNEEKLNFFIEENGRNLSGGQRQRLTIARALVKPHDILILDDAFSALDFATEARVRKTLKEKQGNKSYIVISQRISTVMHADKILVLDGGEPSGLGTHEELLKTSRVYQEIQATQGAGV